jgi:hypothetical protein
MPKTLNPAPEEYARFGVEYTANRTMLTWVKIIGTGSGK